MKQNKFLLSSLFFVLMITSCVSQQPQSVSIQDGVRCPLPSQKTASNTSSSKRVPASVATKSTDQTCNQLFGK